MYDFQNTVLLPARPDKSTKLLRNISLILLVMSLLICLWLSFLFLPILIAAAIFVWWTMFRTSLEYEYTYFDGDLDIDKIRAKARRKKVISISMEDVTSIVPADHPSLHNVHQRPGIKKVDASSRMPDRKVYEIVHQEAGTTTCILFEPDEKFLDQIAVKYPRLITR